MAKYHQCMLELTLIHENTDNVIQNHTACAVGCHSKRMSSFTVELANSNEILTDTKYLT